MRDHPSRKAPAMNIIIDALLTIIALLIVGFAYHIIGTHFIK